MNYGPENPFQDASGPKRKVVDDIWKPFHTFINETNKIMRRFLGDFFGLQNFYSKSNEFDNIDEIARSPKEYLM